jgi:hypothetical protein
MGWYGGGGILGAAFCLCFFFLRFNFLGMEVIHKLTSAVQQFKTLPPKRTQNNVKVITPSPERRRLARTHEMTSPYVMPRTPDPGAFEYDLRGDHVARHSQQCFAMICRQLLVGWRFLDCSKT